MNFLIKFVNFNWFNFAEKSIYFSNLINDVNIWVKKAQIFNTNFPLKLANEKSHKQISMISCLIEKVFPIHRAIRFAKLK